MIKLTAIATVHSISPVIQVSANFSKRELILDDSWERNGEVHPNFVLIEFSGDAMAQLNNVYPGQRVTVEAYVNGREWNNRIINSIRGRSVSPAQQTGYQQAAPAPTYPQQTYPQGYPQAQPAPAQMPGYGQPPAQYPQQGYAMQQPQQAPLPQQTQQPQTSAPAQMPNPSVQPQQGTQQSQQLGVSNLPFTT